MREHSWTRRGRTWTLESGLATVYEVARHGPGDYRMFVNGCQVDSADTAENAMARLACCYEYEEHGSELELARLRLQQARERLVNRFPSAARDGQLNSILESLADALGVGPEASDPGYQEARETDIWRKQVSPVLWVAVEASTNVVLELTTPAGRVLARPLASRTDLGLALERAAVFATAAAGEADAARLHGIDERRRAEGRLTRSEAVAWLTAKGTGHSQAVDVTRVVQRHPEDSSLHGMTYDGAYWRVPVNTEQPAR